MKKKKLKCYNVGLDSDVYAISLVEEPAIESSFIYLSKQKQVQVCLEQDEKHIVMGAVLVPNKLIYRNQDGEEFYIQFSKETIEKLAYDYLRSDRVYSFTQQHEDVADNIYVVETWLKTSENDKSKEYGIDVPIGTWMMAAKVENEEIWQKIKAGEMTGFSIEAFVNLSEINLNKQNDMAKENEVKLEAIEINDSFWDKIRGIIADALGKPEKSEEVEETVGEIVDEMEKSAGPKDEETKVVEQEEVKPEDEVKPEETPAEVVDEAVKEVVEEVNEVTETPEEKADALQAIIDGLNEEIAKKDEEIESLKKENTKLSKQPSNKPIVKASAQKENPRDIIEKLYNGTYFQKTK